MSLTISLTAAQTTASTVDVPGSFSQRVLKEVKIVIPTVANTVTFTFAVVDGDGVTRYSKAGIDKDTTTVEIIDKLIVRKGYKFSILPSGATGTIIDCTITPEYEAWRS